MSAAEAGVKLGRLETPTARLVLPSTAARADWLAARMHGITATDLVAIMGLSEYRTAIDVWSSKLMQPDEDELGEAGQWGTILEEPVAQEWANRHGLSVRRIGLVANVDEPWRIASLDRIVQGCPDGRCALEVKTRNLFVGKEWEKELPEDVATQALWQRLVTGLDHVHVAALIGGQKLVEHRVEADPDHEEQLIAAGLLIWEAVQREEIPDLPPELWTGAYVDARYPVRGGSLEVDDAVLETAASYLRVSATIKALEDEKGRLRTALIGALGEHEAASADGRTVYTYRPQNRRTLSREALELHYPEVAADDRLFTTTTTRSLRVTPRKEGSES